MPASRRALFSRRSATTPEATARSVWYRPANDFQFFLRVICNPSAKLRAEGFFMEKQKPAPGSHSELHDPKLPAIHGGYCGNCAQERVCMGPIAAAKPDTARRD